MTSTKFFKQGCFTGDHAKFKTSTCLLYNGSYAKSGGGGGGMPIGGNFDMQAFMKEPVEFENPPGGFKSWSESTKVQMRDGKVSKIVTRTYKM